MLSIINAIPHQTEFVAGMTKKAKCFFIVCYLLLSVVLLLVVYLEKENFHEDWYWKIILLVGVIFLILPLKKENRRATVNIGIDHSFLYIVLPYAYKGKCLKIAKKEVVHIFESLAFNQYRSISIRLREQSVPNDIYDQLSFMMEKKHLG